MKFTAIRLQSNVYIYLPVVNVSASDPYILKSAEGLGPPEVNVFISQTTNMDGYYKGRQAQYREIVLSVGLNQNYKNAVLASDLRAELYTLLSPVYSDAMQIVISDEGNDLMYTTGYVKKLEVVPFSATPEVQLTISCLKSCFEAMDLVHVEVDQDHAYWQSITNEGTAETGIIFRGTMLYDAVGFAMQDSRANVMSLEYEFREGDVLNIDTRPGSRSITVERDGGTINIIHALSMDSNWLWVYSGYNEFRTVSPTFTWDDLSYVPQYWGI